LSLSNWPLTLTWTPACWPKAISPAASGCAAMSKVRVCCWPLLTSAAAARPGLARNNAAAMAPSSGLERNGVRAGPAGRWVTEKSLYCMLR